MRSSSPLVSHILRSHDTTTPRTLRFAYTPGSTRCAMPDSVKPLLHSEPSQTRFNMAKTVENQKRKKVLVVGAGAAGMKDHSSVLRKATDTSKA